MKITTKVMKITTKVVFEYRNGYYIKTSQESYDYTGPVAYACGATAGQNQVGNQQMSFYSQLQNQAGSVFGQDSAVFNDLMSTFAPTVAAGPNQQGFSPQELSNLNSEAITQTGQAYKNAKEAVGNSEAAQGGGTSSLPSGANVGADLSLAESGANQTASELSQITEQNYAVGRQNYQNATQGLAGATNVFNSADNAANAATGAGTAAANTQNQIAQENNSWVQGVTGALGGVLGAATGGLMGGGGSSGGNGYEALYNNSQMPNLQTQYNDSSNWGSIT
jgi:hypothetical protein